MRADFVSSHDQMLHIFDLLEIIHDEIAPAKSDFYDRREMEVLRLAAEAIDRAWGLLGLEAHIGLTATGHLIIGLGFISKMQAGPGD